MAMNDMLAGAIAHLGTSRTAEFRNQLKAIELATPSAQQDANWNGRGDG
jgi:hypothetical protein